MLRFIFTALIFIFSISSATENYLEKLKKPIIKEKANQYYLVHYDKITFKEKTYVLFKEFKEAILKTECSMKKGLISKGNFVAICVSMSSGFSQGLFQPVFEKIKTIQWVLDPEKIKKADFIISINFTQTGVNVNLSHERGSQKLVIPYKDIILTVVNP